MAVAVTSRRLPRAGSSKPPSVSCKPAARLPMSALSVALPRRMGVRVLYTTRSQTAPSARAMPLGRGSHPSGGGSDLNMTRLEPSHLLFWLKTRNSHECSAE